MRIDRIGLILLITLIWVFFSACNLQDEPGQGLPSTELPPIGTPPGSDAPTLMLASITPVVPSPSYTITPSPTQIPTLTMTPTQSATPTPPDTLTPTRPEPTAIPTVKGDLVPEGILPDLRTNPPTDLRLLYNPNTGRALIRFTNSIWNSGPGVLELIGEPNRAQGQIRVYQRVFSADPEVFDEFEVGEFVYHDEHDHWHFGQFATYELWKIAENDTLGELISSKGKVSWCVIDETPVEMDLPGMVINERPLYTHCEGEIQGLSVGWIDIYEYYLPGQWVGVDSLEDGLYILVSTVDPDHLLYEANVDNNTGVTFFEVRDLRLVQ